MRLLCVTAYYKPAWVYGGPVSSMGTLFEALAKLGIDVTVYTTNANGRGSKLNVPTGQSSIINGVRVFYFPTTWRDRIIPFYSSDLRKSCEMTAASFDIIYICGTWTYPMKVAAIAAKDAGRPYIVNPTGSFMEWSMQYKWFKKFIYLSLVERELVNNAASIHCTSDMEKAQTSKLGFEPPIISIPNGIDLKQYRTLPNRGTIRHELGIPTDGAVLLFVGRIHVEKRIDEIIKALKLLRDESRDVHLLIVGPDSGCKQDLVRLAFDLRLNSFVHFMGLLKGMQLLQTYVDADLLLLVSERENFGMVILEAMATGLPVVVSKEVGLAPEVEKSGAGRVVSGISTEIRDACLEILGDRPLANEMGKRGKSTVFSRFSAEVIASDMHAFLNLHIGVN